MIRKFLLVLMWFPMVFALLAVNLALLGKFSTKTPSVLSAQTPYTEPGLTFTATAGTPQVLQASVIAADARAILLESFLRRNKSPMAPFAENIVSSADAYQIDYRLVPAIAMCESNLGKRLPKKDEYNAWGIAVYTGKNTGARFNDWPHAIDWVTRYIREHYFDRGYTDLYDIGAIWAPPSVENGYSWTNCVLSFQEDIIS